MNVGDKVQFSFGKKKEMKEGTIVKIKPKNIFLSVDFDNHKGKIIKRKAHQLA
jgi:hypothetical protein